MTSLQITEADIPSLDGKTAVVTGGASGIGLAAAKILLAKGCRVFILDLQAPDDGTPRGATFVKCDVSSWAELRDAFARAAAAAAGEGGGRVDIAIANAGVSEERPYLEDRLDDAGQLLPPDVDRVIGVNFRAVVYFVKLAHSIMRKQHGGGSIVVTASATGYAPEQSLPVYSGTKAGVLGFVRALRSMLPRDNVSINGVAPAATITKLLPMDLATPMMAAGCPISSAHFVGLAVVFSAVAGQERRVEDYGRDDAGGGRGKWNGRVILTLGENYTELEEELAATKPRWLGKKNAELTRHQQGITDSR